MGSRVARAESSGFGYGVANFIGVCLATYSRQRDVSSSPRLRIREHSPSGVDGPIHSSLVRLTLPWERQPEENGQGRSVFYRLMDVIFIWLSIAV